MAIKYLYHGGSNSGGTSWANAYTSLQSAIAGLAAGDTLYVAHDHLKEYTSTTTLTIPGGSTAITKIICVNRAGSVPPTDSDITTGAIERSTTGALHMAGSAFYIYGMKLGVGYGQSSAYGFSLSSSANALCIYENCELGLYTTGSSAAINPSVNEGAVVKTINCKFKFTSTSQKFSNSLTGQSFTIKNTNGESLFATGSSIPTALFSGSSGTGGSLILSGVDLSSISGSLFVAGPVPCTIENCKLHSSVTIGAAHADWAQCDYKVINCKSGSGVPRNEIYNYRGTLTTETTVVRTGGASDETTPFSWKIVTPSRAVFIAPFETFEGIAWNSDAGVSKTLTVHTVTDNITLTNKEIWLEVEYLSSSSSPITSAVSDVGPSLDAASNQPSSSEAWTTTGLSTPVYQKLECTFTPQMAGPIRWRVKYAKVSSTVYVCPKAELT